MLRAISAAAKLDPTWEEAAYRRLCLATADANSYNENVNVPNRGDLLESAETKALVADICFITGGVLATTGVILLIVSSQQRGEETERPDDLVRFELGPTRDGWAVGLSGRF